MATQNPIEQEGTYPLPEAQLDRFMMEIRIGYPTPRQEEEIVMKTSGAEPALPEAAFGSGGVFGTARIGAGRCRCRQSVAAYAVKLCGASRPGDPAGRPAGQGLRGVAPVRAGRRTWCVAAKALSLLEGRAAPTVQDIRAVAMPVLRHRVLANHRAIGDAVTPTRSSPGCWRRSFHNRENARHMSSAATMQLPSGGRFLDLAALQSLSRLRFVTRGRIEGAYSGRHASRQRGGSAEFVEYRQYVPAKTFGGSTGKCWGEPSGLICGCTRMRPIFAARR